MSDQYFYEKPQAEKHYLKISCTLCNQSNSAIYWWLLKEKNNPKDHIKHVCANCRNSYIGVTFHESIYGKKQEIKNE